MRIDSYLWITARLMALEFCLYMAKHAIIGSVETFMKRKTFKDFPAFPVLYPQYVYENRIRIDVKQEKTKPVLDMDYVRALVILIVGILVLISI